MDQFFKEIQHINNVDDAINKLKTQIDISPKLYEIINFIIEAHEGQFRKSGEPYCVHPILVATITASFSKDEAVIATALLHDVVEDTPYTLDEWFGGMLLERKHPVLREYLERELRIRNEILDRLKNAPNAEKRAGEIEEEKQAVIAALEEYEGI